MVRGGAALFMVDEPDQIWRSFTDPIEPIPPTSDFIYGETKPSADNTGLTVSEGSLETVAGNISYGSLYNGQTIRYKKFTGTVTVTATNLTFEDCWLNPTEPGSGGQVLAVNCNNDSVLNLVFRRCKFRPNGYSYRMYACFGRNYTLDRCDTSGFVDLCSIVGKNTTSVDLNVKIYGCYFHNQLYKVPDPNQTDNYTHNDGIQIHYGGKHIDIFGNTFMGNCDLPNSDTGSPVWSGTTIQSGNKYSPQDPIPISVVMCSPVAAAAPMNDFKFRKNWMTGAVCGINWPRTDGTDISITDNRWGETYVGVMPMVGITYDGKFFILMKSGQAATVTGNYFEATGVPYNTRRNG